MNYRLISFIALLLFSLAACKERTPADVRHEYKQITPGNESRTMQQVALDPKPTKFVWPGDAPDLNLVFHQDEDIYARNYLVVLDVSGSMEGDKLEDAKQALQVFSQAMKPTDYLGLVLFSSGTHLALPLDRVERNRDKFLQAVNATRAGGGTDLSDGMKLGYKELTRAGQLQLGYGTYTLVVVTDGDASPGQDPRQDVNFMIENTPIQVYTIGFHIGQRHSLNMPGQTTYVEANNRSELTEGLRGALAESLDMFNQ